MCYYAGCSYLGIDPNHSIWSQQQHTLKNCVCLHKEWFRSTFFSSSFILAYILTMKGIFYQLQGSEVLGPQNGNSKLSKGLWAVPKFCTLKNHGYLLQHERL